MVELGKKRNLSQFGYFSVQPTLTFLLSWRDMNDIAENLEIAIVRNCEHFVMINIEARRS